MKNMWRIFAAALAMLLFIAAPALAYFDLDGFPAAQVAAVEALSDMGVVNGYPDGSFRPQATMNRAEFAKVLCQFAAQEQLTLTRPVFSDVPQQTWYFGWVNRAVEQGWIEGYPDGGFRPQNTITQQEVAAVLVRLSGVETVGFAWPDDYIEAARQAGILDDVEFKGNNEASRLSACLMLYALLPKQPPQPEPELPADGLYLGVVADVFSGGEGPQISLWELAQNLPITTRSLPKAHTFIYYTLKEGQVTEWHLLLDPGKKAVMPTTALTRLTVPEGPYAWASRATGAAQSDPPGLDYVKPQVLYYSYRNITVGPNSQENRNYWLSDESLIYLVDEAGNISPGSRADIQEKQTVTLLADKNDEVRYLFCY